MQRYILLTITLLSILGCTPALAAGENMDVPKDIYEWVQSTPRASYYFNKQQMCYAVRADGTIDINTLIVPTIKLYDDIQKQDVIAKKRWKQDGSYNDNLRVYNDLVGAAEYLSFDLKNNKLTITEHDDLDSTWTTIAKDDTDTEPADISSFSDKQVEGKFYKAILTYADKHQDELIKRTRGVLSEADKKILDEKKNPPVPVKDKKKTKKQKH